VGFLNVLAESSLDAMFVIAGLSFLGIAALGGMSAKIKPGRFGRMGAALVGPVLILVGLWIHTA